MSILGAFPLTLEHVVAATTTLQNFGSHVNFEAYLGSWDRSSLVTCWYAVDLKLPLLDLMSWSCYHLHAACVIFGRRYCCLSCKGNVVLLQGKACARELLSSHRHVSHSLHALLSQRLLHQEKYVLYILDGLCCITKCSCAITVKSYRCLHLCHWSHT